MDMDWYAVHVNSVMTIVYETCEAIMQEIKTIYLPTDADSLIAMAQDWCSIQQSRYGFQIDAAGIVLAGDGLVVPINQPTNVDNPAMYRNRHDCYALIVQAFCDAYCRFRVFDVNWPGATNDLTAYSQTALFQMMRSTDLGTLPTWMTIIMDAIYTPCGGNHLTPFTASELEHARQTDAVLYLKMLTYNHFLVSQRVTIERAFGQLVRRFGIFWRPIAAELHRVPLLATTCAVLHNVCIERWIMKGRPGRGRYGPEVLEHVNVDGLHPHDITDNEILARVRNHYQRLEAIGNKIPHRRLAVMEAVCAVYRVTAPTQFYTIV